MRNSLEKIGIDLHTTGETSRAEGAKLFDDAYTKLPELMQ